MDGYGRSLRGLAFRLEAMGRWNPVHSHGLYHYHLASMLLSYVHRDLPIHVKGVCGAVVASSYMQ